MAYHVRDGQYGDVTLAGLNVVVVAGFFLDARADDRQREALDMIFSGQAGGWMGGFGRLIKDVRGEAVAPMLLFFHPVNFRPRARKSRSLPFCASLEPKCLLLVQDGKIMPVLCARRYAILIRYVTGGVCLTVPYGGKFYGKTHPGAPRLLQMHANSSRTQWWMRRRTKKEESWENPPLLLRKTYRR